MWKTKKDNFPKMIITYKGAYFSTHVSSISPNDLEIKETTDNNLECSFLDMIMFNDENELKFKL